MEHHGRQCGTEAARETRRGSRRRRSEGVTSSGRSASGPDRAGNDSASSEASIVRRIRAEAEREGCLTIKIHGSQFMPPGIPDLLLFRRGRAFAAEVKRPGKKPTACQVAFMARLERAGIPCAVLTDSEGLHDLLRR